MQRYIFIWIFLLVFIIGCQNKIDSVNTFSIYYDTLIITTEKQKGNGLFLPGAGDLQFRDTNEMFPYPIVLPNGLADIKRAQINTDFKANDSKYVDIIIGVRNNNEKVFIVDQNNNKDLSDDSIRVWKEIEWYSDQDLISVMYQISNGRNMINDSSWIRMGTSNGSLMYGRSEHLIAKFVINSKSYKVGIIDQVATMTFTYGFDPEIALISSNSTEKDTLSARDLIRSGEFLSLDGIYYRFDSITNDGGKIVLIKEEKFENQVGTQVGMIAPEFECVSTEGDTINSAKLINKMIIIANSCGCGGDRKSTDAYYKITEKYIEEAHVLHLDSNIKKESSGLHIDMENKYNKAIYNQYRGAYCSRMCYVISKNNRIIDKFEITDWESALPKIL